MLAGHGHAKEEMENRPASTNAKLRFAASLIFCTNPIFSRRYPYAVAGEHGAFAYVLLPAYFHCEALKPY